MSLEKFTERARVPAVGADRRAAHEPSADHADAHLKALLEDEQGMASGLIARAGGSAEAARRETDEALAKILAVTGTGASGSTPALDGETIRLLDSAEQNSTADCLHAESLILSRG
jgi:ATP-dependent Clp protease ATP-binding subunit ClpB